jgi:hypothetical protein
LNGRSVAARIAAISFSICAAPSTAVGNAPSPPAFDTAIASAEACAPAIGA